MSKTYKDRESRAVPNSKSFDPYEREAEEISVEHKSRLRRHEMVDFSDLYLAHDDEMRQERGLDW